MTNFDDELERIVTREDLIVFLTKLALSVEEDPEAWESDRLDLYLEAMAGWLGDYEGAYINQGREIPRTPTWKFFGEILLAGRTYE